MKLKSMLSKVKTSFKSRKVGKVIAGASVAVVSAMYTVVSAFAATEPVSDVAPDAAAREIFGVMSQQLNFTTILSVLGVVILAALAMVLGWWAIRKVSMSLMKAFTKGKLSI